ncbi:MAG: peptide deformylase [Porticoccaceae bacterium]|nr:peptide deformylase [Porticoccaceae bacterium]
MTTLTILEFPDPRLRKQARLVADVDKRVIKIVEDMFETMYAADGVGLAATQVDIHERIVVIDISELRNQPQVFINPEVEVLTDDRLDYEEGCLSVPGFRETVSRAEQVRVKALDRDGKPLEIKASGLLAVCIQHELDHLTGKLFVDYISPLKRQRIRKKLEKQHKQLA